MNDVSVLRLQDAWRQCEKHLHYLKHALQALTPHLPVLASSLDEMNEEVVQDWDQFVLRFTKLQDAIGSRLYPALLVYLQEPYQDRPMLDKLNRLESLSYLSSVNDWNTLRIIRNTFAHDYPQDDALKASYLNAAVAAVPLFDQLLARVAPVVKRIH
jgi:hypothetical protein